MLRLLKNELNPAEEEKKQADEEELLDDCEREAEEGELSLHAPSFTPTQPRHNLQPLHPRARAELIPTSLKKASIRSVQSVLH